jgi:hypothetical protein
VLIRPTVPEFSATSRRRRGPWGKVQLNAKSVKGFFMAAICLSTRGAHVGLKSYMACTCDQARVVLSSNFRIMLCERIPRDQIGGLIADGWKRQAISYAQERACLPSGEIRTSEGAAQK